MSTPTPRTDAAYAEWQSSWTRTPFGPDLARTLERELAAERARVDQLILTHPLYDARDQLDAAMKEGA